MNEAEAYQRGLEIRERIWGPAANERLQRYGDAHPEFARMLVQYLFGEVWSRPELPLRSRSLITMAILTALNRTPELAIHIRGALRLGIPREEITEVIVHAGMYAGIPVAVEGLRTATQVFEEETGE